MKIDEKEVLRYLGYKGKPADELIRKSVHYCIEQLEENCKPRSISKTVPVHFDNNAVIIGKLSVMGRDLREHLRGCEKAILFAATLGPNADMLLERMSKVDISRAAVLQAAAAAMIESYCDEVQSVFAAKAAEEQLYLRPRYSPGYGDFSIRYQKDLLSLLDCPRKIGLTITDSFMLAPTKSVTAVIGLTGDSKGCSVSNCMICKSQNCPFRKD